MKIIDLIEDAETLREILKKIIGEYSFMNSEILDFVESSGKLRKAVKTAMRKYDSLDFDLAVEKSVNRDLREENDNLKTEIEKLQKLLVMDSEKVSDSKTKSVDAATGGK